MDSLYPYTSLPVEDVLDKQYKKTQSLLHAHHEEARALLLQSDAMAMKMMLENQELRTQLAQFKQALGATNPMATETKAQALAHKQHHRQKDVLVSRDQQARRAESECQQLREQLADFQNRYGMNEDEDLQDQKPLAAQKWKTIPSPTTLSFGKMPSTSTDIDLVKAMKLPGEPIDDSLIDPSKRDDATKKVSKGASRRRKNMEAEEQRQAELRAARAIDMREKMRTMFTKSEDFTQFYHKTGCTQKIARHPYFDHTCMFLVLANTIWLGIDCAFNDADVLSEALLIFIIVENVFCVAFAVELLIRVLALQKKTVACTNYWLLSDTFIVSATFFETWVVPLMVVIADAKVSLFSPAILRMVRAMKLFKLGRLIRLMRLMPEVMILAKGLAVAARSVFFTMLLLAAIIYGFTIALTQLCKDTRPGELYFNDFAETAFTLALRGCFGEGLPEVVKSLFEEHFVLGLIFLAFLVIGPLTVMNMLIGVLVQVVGVAASVEAEALDEAYFKDRIQSVMTALGQDPDGSLTKEDLWDMINDQTAACQTFMEIGIDILAIVEYPDIIFNGCDNISFQELLDNVLLLRSHNSATVKDVFAMRKALCTDIKAWVSDSVNAEGVLD
eukprot:TRINITY_DN28224_c0_g1_i2.p1 TRINITY_DN28224_c0_g1~~TRINITY_DN28224_c0_g1_i2.p1  ORF type:complete len:616 (-),score=144.92 TRINITY_DN28224_c0_g1_i2:19-1866(-)